MDEHQQANPASQEKFLSENELLARIPICRRTAFNWIQQGKLPCVKIGRRKLFHWPTVEAALLRQQRGGGQ
ncbi:MAG: helix-turn-helix transcriptional regulator [Limisphaerales bacterium]